MGIARRLGSISSTGIYLHGACNFLMNRVLPGTSGLWIPVSAQSNNGDARKKMFCQDWLALNVGSLDHQHAIAKCRSRCRWISEYFRLSYIILSLYFLQKINKNGNLRFEVWYCWINGAIQFDRNQLHHPFGHRIIKLRNRFRTE
jgi:hypothetical protein